MTALAFTLNLSDPGTLIFLFSVYLGLVLITLKYGTLRTKILYVTSTSMILGTYLVQNGVNIGYIPLAIGIIISARYIAKFIKDFIPSF